jgi:hypothetical protein
LVHHTDSDFMADILRSVFDPSTKNRNKGESLMGMSVSSVCVCVVL